MWQSATSRTGKNARRDCQGSSFGALFSRIFFSSSQSTSLHNTPRQSHKQVKSGKHNAGSNTSPHLQTVFVGCLRPYEATKTADKGGPNRLCYWQILRCRTKGGGKRATFTLTFGGVSVERKVPDAPRAKKQRLSCHKITLVGP